MAGEENRRDPAVMAVTDWSKVTVSHGRGDHLKAGFYITLSKAGAAEAGVEATELALEIAESRGLTDREWAFEFHASESTAQIACTPIPLSQVTKGSGLIRWQGGHGSPRAAWHLGGVFRQFRKLRPKADVKCQVTRGTGPDGKPVLIIPVGASLVTQSHSRETAPISPGAQTPASE